MLSRPATNVWLYFLGSLASAAALIDLPQVEPYGKALGALGAALLGLGRWDRVVRRP